MRLPSQIASAEGSGLINPKTTHFACLFDSSCVCHQIMSFEVLMDRTMTIRRLPFL
jgi:hypothetical protein